MKYLLSIFTLVIILSGCHPTDSQIENGAKENTYLNQDLHYAIDIPEMLSESGTWLNSSTREQGPFFGSEVDKSIDPPFGKRHVNMNIHHFSSSCSSDHIGALEVKEIQAMGDTTLWAKMPLLSAYDRFQNTFCHPAPPDCTDTELFTGTCETDYAMYAFCSEQGEKTVAICLSQMTDDPEMAEEIFKTFRWVK